MIKVRLTFETGVAPENWDGTQYDLLRTAVSNFIDKGKEAESTDDWAELFVSMEVDGSTSHPGFANSPNKLTKES